MALRDLTDRSAVLTAIEEADRIGEPAFLAKYGFDSSRRYRIAHDGKTYPSKPVLAAAHAVQFPTQGPLASDDFSGGRQTLERAEALGFEVVDLGAQDDLGVALARFMRLLQEARSLKFSHGHPAVDAVKACATLIEKQLPAPLKGSVVRPSVGQGNWASVPWIAVLHPQVTTTTQQGVYPVLLFDEDLQSVAVTIAQGVTDLKGALGRRAAVEELHARSELLRSDLSSLTARGFRGDIDFELGRSTYARDYVDSTVVHKTFSIDDLPKSTITADLEALLAGYGYLVESGALNRLEARSTDDSDVVRQALMIYVGQAADANFESGGRKGWWGWRQAPSGLETLRPGDLIAFGRGFDGGSPRVEQAVWQEHGLRGVVVGRITSTPERTDEQVMPDELSGEASYPWKLRFEILGEESSVRLASGERLSGDAAEALRRSALNRGMGYPVPVAGSPLLEAYMSEGGPVAPDAVMQAANAFVEAVADSGLRLPAADVTAFLAAVAAKPFAILTGQSGSGKTQLAKRLGEWCGADSRGRPRYLVVPVRPDWTGPEYLFGYPDALRSSGGTEVWAVPDPLEFMLRAAAEPTEPYLLLLDEMNLAHVERYFADFLSGLESREPVLPELVQRDGQWVAVGNSQRLPLPRNLLVVGTVNVDETTYMFSPKVLDRAFTFEFRTAPEDLDPSLRRPTTIAPAAQVHRDVLVRLAQDDEWQHEHPHPHRNDLVEELRELHGLLRDSGNDFGHRVFYEALRYASFLEAMGVDDRWDILDRVVLTKLLPKLHGTRSRIEKTLRNLSEFAQGGAGEGEPASMPLTAEKLARMIAVLVEAQFVSFTE